MEGFYGKVTANQKSGAGLPDLIEGYVLARSECKKTLDGGYLNFDKLYDNGAAIADDPATCAEKLNELRELLGITEFALWTNIGGMPSEESMSALRLIMNDVAPRVNALEAAG